MPCLIDNDAALKLSAWSLLDDWVLQVAQGRVENVTMLQSARFYFRSKKSLPAIYGSKAVERARDFAEKCSRLSCAPEAELVASLNRPGIDPGEVSLLAALVGNVDWILLTGDKTALAAVGAAADLAKKFAPKIAGRVIVLEQVLLAWIEMGRFYALRDAVASAATVDNAIAIAFSGGVQTTEEHARAALKSYVEDVRKKSAGLLMNDAPLAALLKPGK